MSIAILKKKSELMKVTAAKYDMQIYLAELKDKIEKVEKDLLIQEQTEERLKDEIEKLKE